MKLFKQKPVMRLPKRIVRISEFKKMKLLEALVGKTEMAKMHRMKIVLPESEDARILKAAEIASRNKLGKIILLGKEDKIKETAKKNKIKLDGIEFISPNEKYAELLHELRKHREMTIEEAKKLSKDPVYYGALMVKSGEADGMVAGAITTSEKVVRTALQVIQPEEGIKTVSGAFLIVLPFKGYGEKILKKSIFLFADCAVNIDPTEEQLAEIALASAETAKSFGIEPRIAMLSYHTHASDLENCRTKMCKAVNIVKNKNPRLKIEEIQLDAALDSNVAVIKNPETEITGKANILIFPDLYSGNIGYKLVERFAGARAVGPILQGLQKPVNDLSRGCSVEDIVYMITFTSYQACCAKK